MIVRFGEQAWPVGYYTVYWSYGFYILHQSPLSPFSSSYLWTSYPHTPLPGLTKFYYLSQLGFWFHQLFALNLEERRKDFWQMLSHHVVTTLLVAGSYWMNYTRVGTVILVLMDFCDILLPLAKIFKYMSLPRLTDFTFVLFLLSWLITRQIGFFAIFLSTILKAPSILPWGWVPEEERYVNKWTVHGFQSLLGIIMVMSCIWFWMACTVAWRVIMGQGADDVRSDDEGDALESDTEVPLNGTGGLIAAEATAKVLTAAAESNGHALCNGLNGRVEERLPKVSKPDIR